MNFADRNRIFIEKLRNLPDKKKKIILWAIIIVLGVIMGIFWVRGVVGNFYKITESTKSISLPSVDLSSMDILQTTGWKTYTNAQYGFEIKIPGDWIVKENSEGLTFTTEDLLKQQEQNRVNCQQGKDCDPGELPYAISYFRYIAKSADTYTSDEIANGSSQIELNQIKWTRYQPQGFLADIHFRTTDDNGKGYDFDVYMDTDENTMKSVLSTFKFLNK